jgi:hypothetical protein
MWARALPLAALAGCAPIHPSAVPTEDLSGCTTECGLFAPFVHGRSCGEFQEAESRTLHAFDRYVANWTRSRTCAALDRWSVFVAPDADRNGVFRSPDDGTRVMGQTFMEYRTVFVGLQNWGDSSLSHELAHVVSWTIEHDSSHDLWTERNICTAINMASDHFHCIYDEPKAGEVLR